MDVQKYKQQINLQPREIGAAYNPQRKEISQHRQYQRIFQTCGRPKLLDGD